MFTIFCQHCNNKIKVDMSPVPNDVLCPICSGTNQLKEEEHYCPTIIMIQGQEKGQEYSITGPTTLGRGTYNTIQLLERKASRKHAVIKFSETNYTIEDLKSGNGTFVNGQPITTTTLNDKDLIRIADAVFMFRNTYEYSKANAKAVDNQAVLAEEESAFKKTKAELKFDAQHSFLMSAQEIKDITDLEKANTKLRILYEVNHAISSILDFQELLGKILEVVFQYIPVAERGAILLYDAENDILQSTVTKVRNQEDSGQIKISKTMMERVTREQVSILTTDAMVDEQLAEAMSIITQGIRSAMSVPLISKENLLGVLHIDSTQKSSQFNQDTLELLTGIAGQAAIAIENAKLIKEIEREVETRGHLQRYLSPELVEQVVNKQITIDIGGKLKKATMLFTDLRGFTKMTENIGAEAVVQVLNDYFTRMVDIIFANGGTLDKFIGDAIMAIWGLPVGHPKDAVRTVKASLQMQKELFYFNISQKKMGRNTLKMGAGINVGDVVVGNMGSPKRMEYTVIGPPVNLASRVESLTAKNQVLVSDNTYNEIKHVARTVELDATHVKGIERAIQIYGVVGIFDDETKTETTFLPVLIHNGEDFCDEGLIQFFDFKRVIMDIEPHVKIESADTIKFILDLPSIAPVEPIEIVCKESMLDYHNGNDEFLKVEGEVISLPNVVKTFFEQVFPKQNFEMTIYNF